MQAAGDGGGTSRSLYGSAAAVGTLNGNIFISFLGYRFWHFLGTACVRAYGRVFFSFISCFSAGLVHKMKAYLHDRRIGWEGWEKEARKDFDSNCFDRLTPQRAGGRV